MAKTGGDLLIERLIEWGVDTIFGLPGDGINGFSSRYERIRTRFGLFRFATKKPLHLWRQGTPNLRVSWAFVWPLPAVAASIC